MAVTLAKYFGKVYYYNPWQNSFPTSNELLIGSGLAGIQKIYDFFDIIHDVDLFVFPDVYCGGIQVHLEELGKRVWGSRKGEELEIYRDKSKEHLKSLGLPVGKYEVVIGMESLRKYLKQHADQFVKINVTRGDTETFYAENYKLIEPKLDQLEHSLGAMKYSKKFIVEENIRDAVETGYDGYTIDGQFPTKGIYGVEIKDKGYIAIVQDYNRFPEEIRGFNDVIADTLSRYHYRNFFSTELRIVKDKTAYCIDPCTRAGSPPSEIYIDMFKNLPDILWFGAEGRCIDFETDYKFGVELLIHSRFADDNWQAIQFPESIRDNVKLRDLTMINNNYYVIPQGNHVPEIGSVVALGNTLEETVDKLKDIVEQVKSYDLGMFPDVIEEAQKEINRLKDWGINLT
jgi:hypothetical protein